MYTVKFQTSVCIRYLNKYRFQHFHNVVHDIRTLIDLRPRRRPIQIAFERLQGEIGK